MSIKIIQVIFFKSIKPNQFIPAKTYIPASGKVFDDQELTNGIAAILDGWWTEGRFAKEFEKEFSKVCGCRYVTLTNSGSSANLLAVSSLTSSVFGKRKLEPGDEVITVACGFPTTVNPIIQNRLTPVFLDVDLKTKNIRWSDIKKIITKKTKAIMFAHTLGNPAKLDTIASIAKEYNLWLIEDCCDALGATYNGKPVGTYGDIATYSFYPAHQITMGEGGAVVTNAPLIHKSFRQFRDWGRDCWCDTGQDDTCRRRFSWKLGDLPYGYDHKYIYSQVGYNLKLTDMQAAIGCAQLKKLPQFVAQRNETFEFYKKHLSRFSRFISFSESEGPANPSWFGFFILIDARSPFTKQEMVLFLEKNKVGTRNLFAGNLLKHPAYLFRSDFRAVGSLKNTDAIMERGFWIGVYPGITKQMRRYVVGVFEKFFAQFR